MSDYSQACSEVVYSLNFTANVVKFICKWLVQKDRLDVMNLRYSRLALPPLLQITIAYAYRNKLQVERT